MADEQMPLWIPQAQFKKLFGLSNSKFHRWRRAGVIPESAISRKPGRHPYVDANAVFPEQVKTMREVLERYDVSKWRE